MTLTQVVRFEQSVALAVTSSYGSGGTVVKLRGEADAFTKPTLVNALVAAIANHDGPVIVDLSQADFIDVGTVRVLARAAHDLRDHGRAMSFRSPSRSAANLIELFGLSSLCEVLHD